MHDLLIALILGIVEGLTEFIPVSSTGHLILAGHLLDFEGDRASTFETFIQLGAILAIVILYWHRFWGLLDFRHQEQPRFAGLRGILLLALTSIPAFAVGWVSYDFIKDNLFTPLTVAIGLGLGGVAILLIEPRLPAVKRESVDALTPRDALLIGLFQCLSLWPGVSRAAATILGGMLIGVERKTAAEYSFFAAVPALFAAGLYDLYQNLDSLSSSDIPMFATGFVVSFVAAWFAVRFFLRLLGSHTLVRFGWYRIGLAILVLVVLA